MKLPWHRRRPVSRGQALVEFALILPILMLLLLLAIDFGRVFFGWVALNNAARIAASEAGWHPDAWEGTGDAALQDNYRGQVVDDLTAINCAPAGGGAWAISDIPDPTFVDVAGTFSTDPYELGDHAQVKLTCDFSFLTPFLGNVLGNPLAISATAEFPVKGGEVDGVPVGGAVPSVPASCTGAIVPSMVGQTVAAAQSAWTGAGFTGGFSATGGSTETVTSQTTDPASSPGDCIAKTASVTVTSETSCTAPQLIGLKSSAGASAFSGAGFTGVYTIHRPPSNDYTIASQSLVGGQVYVCSSGITVFK